MIQNLAYRLEAAPAKVVGNPMILDPLLRLYYTQKFENMKTLGLEVLAMKFSDSVLVGENTQLTLSLVVKVLSNDVLNNFIQSGVKKETHDTFSIVSVTRLV